MELYRKALSEKAAPADKKQSTAEPQLVDAWMTDLEAAQKKALELQRPLVVYFWAKWSGPATRMKVEVL